MKVLFCHHLEPIWNEGMKRYGTNIYRMCEKVTCHILENDYDAVIITQFEFNRTDMAHDCYFPIFAAIEEKGISIEWHDYAYGWELDSFNFEDVDAAREKLKNGEVIQDEYGTKLAQGGTHSEVVLLEDWIENLKSHEVFLCGAFDGECIEDIQLTFEACGVDYKRLSSLII